MPPKKQEHQHPGVFERIKGSGVYSVRWTDAKGRRRKQKVGSFTAAVKVYNQRSSEAKLNLLLPATSGNKVRFGELVADALVYSENHHKDAVGFRTRVELVLLDFKDHYANLITTGELQQWMDEMAEEREWEPGTRNRYKSSLSVVFREGMRAGKVLQNPARLLRHFKEATGRIRFLSDEEETILRKAIKDPLNGRKDDAGKSAFFQLDVALHTGMRRSEQFTAEWSQVNFLTRTIYLDKTKNGSDRHVKLNSEALRVLQELKAWHDELRLPRNSKLFLSKFGEPIENPRKWFDTACKAAGIEGVTWHTLRHTFASRLVMEGVNLKTVQELMGHKTIAMTARYAHLAPGYLESELETLVARRARLGHEGENQVEVGPKLVSGASWRSRSKSEVVKK